MKNLDEDSSNLNLASQPWYHGPITRITAELSVANEGDFLVRDCISAPGNFVLTCRWKGQVLHFRMNKIVNQEEETVTNVEFQFEEECFPTVTELILFYLGQQKPISQLSGAIIVNPVCKEDSSSRSNGFYAVLDSLVVSAAAENPNPYNPSSSQQAPTKKNNLQSFYLGEKVIKNEEPQTRATPKKLSATTVSVKKRENPPTSRTRQCQSMILDQFYFPSGLHWANNNSNKAKVNKKSSGKNSSSLPRPKSSEILLAPNKYSREVSRLTFSTFKRSPSESSIAMPFNKSSNQKWNNVVPFPKDIDLPPKTNSDDAPLVNEQKKISVDPEPTKSLYDVPQKPARPCLSEKQVQGNVLYDQPRSLTRLKLKGQIPPPPPSRNNSLSNRKSSTESSKDLLLNNKNNSSEADNYSLISEQSNTDTSYLEHRELTPLLSSDNDSLDVFDSNSLPGEPFPAGLPSNSHPNGLIPCNAFVGAASSSSIRCGPKEDSVVEVGASSSQPTNPDSTSKCNGKAENYHNNNNNNNNQVMSNKMLTTEELTTTEKLEGEKGNIRSLHQPQKFQSQHFFGQVQENKALDPQAVLACHKLLLESSSQSLAKHLTWADCDLLSIRMDKEYLGLPDINSGIHLATLVDGKQLRLDLMERFLCLRHFVLITLFSAINWTQSVDILAKWVDVAFCCAFETGDLFGLSSIVSALCNSHLRQVQSLWDKFDAERAQNSSKYREKLLPLLETLNQLRKEGDPEFVTVPHLIPFISGCKDLREKKSFQKVYKELLCQGNSVEAEEAEILFQGHLERLQRHLNELEEFKENADKILADFMPQPELLDLFSTEFHMRLLWGSRSALADFDGRHAKFERVISALSTICAKLDEQKS